MLAVLAELVRLERARLERQVLVLEREAVAVDGLLHRLLVLVHEHDRVDVGVVAQDLDRVRRTHAQRLVQYANVHLVVGAHVQLAQLGQVVQRSTHA